MDIASEVTKPTQHATAAASCTYIDITKSLVDSFCSLTSLVEHDTQLFLLYLAFSLALLRFALDVSYMWPYV